MVNFKSFKTTRRKPRFRFGLERECRFLQDASAWGVRTHSKLWVTIRRVHKNRGVPGVPFLQETALSPETEAKSWLSARRLE